MNKILAGLLLLLFAAAAIAWGVLPALPHQVVVQVPDTSGHEVPVDGAVYNNGYNVADIDNVLLMTTYLRYKDLLGEPVSAFDGKSQAFRFGRLTYNAGNPKDWQIELDNLGLADLQLEGYTAKPGSALHPAVRDWLISQMEIGADITRLVGRTISDPMCDKKTGQCKQWTDKQLFLFDQAAVSGDQVQRAPLGLWLTHPQTRPMSTSAESANGNLNLLPIALGLMLALAALAVFLSGRRGYAPATI